MEKLVAILQGICPDINFETEERLIDDGLIDSFDLIAIISEIDDTFGTNINVADLQPENFNSAKNIWNFIQGTN